MKYEFFRISFNALFNVRELWAISLGGLFDWKKSDVVSYRTVFFMSDRLISIPWLKNTCRWSSSTQTNQQKKHIPTHNQITSFFASWFWFARVESYKVRIDPRLCCAIASGHPKGNKIHGPFFLFIIRMRRNFGSADFAAQFRGRNGSWPQDSTAPRSEEAKHISIIRTISFEGCWGLMISIAQSSPTTTYRRSDIKSRSLLLLPPSHPETRSGKVSEIIWK